MEINSLNSKLEDEQNLVAQLQKKIKELQVSPADMEIKRNLGFNAQLSS